MRARELGIEIGELEPGPLNAITDVTGVRVGNATLIEGDDVRTGVTVVVPGELPVFAAPFRLNGNGEMTGLEWVRESGLLTTPIGLTNTHSVGVVRDALVAAAVEARSLGSPWSLPVVAETWDGRLNDVNGFHVRAEHVREALEAASGGSVPEGNVGGGTGMVCHGFKGGIGTSSRRAGGHMVGVLVQANYGVRERLTIEGVPVGRELGPDRIPLPPEARGHADGSIIVIVATDAPLLPHQCARLACRSALGIGRTGGIAANGSGDLAIAFATGNSALASGDQAVPLRMLPHHRLDPLFQAVIEATEEAIVNALLAAETMSGRTGTVYRLEPDALADVMRAHGRIP